MLLLLVGCNSNSPDSSVGSGSENIKQRISQFTDAFNSSDTSRIKTFLATYLDDQVEYMPPGASRFKGKEAAIQFFMGYARNYTLNIRFSNEEFFSGGEWAYHKYEYQLEAEPRTGGSLVKDRGQGIHVFRLQSDSSWRLKLDVWNEISSKSAE